MGVYSVTRAYPRRKNRRISAKREKTARILRISLRIIAVAMIVAITAMMVAITILHIQMSAKLTPLREEFSCVAKHSPVQENFHDDDLSGYVTLDYGGMIDEVVEKRNEMLSQYGFVRLGDWHVGGSKEDPEVSFTCIYIYWPWAKP